MKSSLIIFALLWFVSCSRENIKLESKSVSIYVPEYEYPVVNLNPGDGTISVPASGIKKCLDQNGVEVDVALCPPASEAPDKIVLSPAGTITIPVAGSVGGFVQIPVAEGESYSSLPQTEIDDRVASVLTCDSGYVQVDATCVIPGYELYFSSYTTPSISGVCSGSETLTRTTLGCRDNITLSTVNISNCNGQTDPAPTTLYQSPAGTRTRTVGTDTIAESCALGSTTWVQTDITCGNPDQSKQGSGAGATCVDDIFMASDFTYPANPLNPGDGSITLDANGFSTCTNTTKSISADLSKCFIPLPAPTITYQSPAGTRTRTVGTDTISESVAEGATTWVQTDITCGNPDQSKQGSGAGAVCVDDTFVASDFTYPANTLTPGQGSLVVDATGFNTCTNTTKSIVVDNSKCSLPSTLPTTTYLSPAGTRNVVSGVNTIQESCAEGATTCTQTDITCGNPDQSKQGSGAGATCVDDTFVASDFTYPANTLTPGQGSLVVNATGFNTCTNTTKSIVVDNSKCSLPSTLPTTTYLSPAGNYSSPVTGATGGVALVPVAEGESWASLSESEQLSRISSVLVCDSGYVKMGATCLGGVLKIAGGNTHSCVIMKNNEVKCVGRNRVGQLGIATNFGTNTDILIPQTVPDFGLARDIVINYNATCVIGLDDTVRCSGLNSEGQLGNTQASSGSSAGYYQPTLMNVGFPVRDVYLGGNHSCVRVKEANELSPNNNTVRCFGSNRYGQLSTTTTSGNLNTNASALDMTALLGKVQGMSLGVNFTCALLENGTVKCFGINRYGQLGNTTNINTTNVNTTPTTVSGLVAIKKISSGDSHTCAQTFDDQLRCWGLNVYGALGTSTNFSTVSGVATPQVSYTGQVKDFSAISNGHTCLITKDEDNLTNDGLLKCVGSNDLFQSGRSSPTSSDTWETITIPEKVKTVSLGWKHTCYTTEDDEPYCFGNNETGQLGAGDTVNGFAPRPYLYK